MCKKQNRQLHSYYYYHNYSLFVMFFDIYIIDITECCISRSLLILFSVEKVLLK